MDGKKLKEVVMYLIFGVLTTLVNIVVFKAFNAVLGIKLYLVSNVIAWIAAVAFAYIVNKLWVFESKSWEAALVKRELLSFLTARIFSLLVESAGLYLMVDICGMKSTSLTALGREIAGEDIAKYIMQFVVVVMNYVFSKLVIFKRK